MSRSKEHFGSGCRSVDVTSALADGASASSDWWPRSANSRGRPRLLMPRRGVAPNAVLGATDTPRLRCGRRMAS
jgi:hypothetical protein